MQQEEQAISEFLVGGQVELILVADRELARPIQVLLLSDPCKSHCGAPGAPQLDSGVGTGACNARSASRRCRFTEGFSRAPRGIFLKCSSLWASEFLRECLPKLAVKVTARPEFSACMQRSLAQPGSGADP